jgi:hypothetical protein
MQDLEPEGSNFYIDDGHAKEAYMVCWSLSWMVTLPSQWLPRSETQGAVAEVTSDGGPCSCHTLCLATHALELTCRAVLPCTR